MTESTVAPTVRSWQDGYEIPLNVTVDTISDEDGEHTTWTYDRLITASLEPDSVRLAAQKAGLDADLAVAAIGVGPRVEALEDAVDTLILDSLMGGA